MKEFKIGDLVQVQYPDKMYAAKIVNIFDAGCEVMYESGLIEWVVKHFVTKRDRLTINEENEMKLEIAGETNASLMEAYTKLELENEELRNQLKAYKAEYEVPQPPTRRFDLEEKIMKAWNTVDDIDLIYHITDNLNLRADDLDELQKQLLGLKSLTELRFQTLWNLFENMIKTGEIK